MSSRRRIFGKHTLGKRIFGRTSFGQRGPIRVLVADMAALDGDIVARIAGERPDMTIVGRVDGPAQAATALTPDVDLLLVSASGPGSLCGYLRLMWTRPRLGVVVVNPCDRLGVVRVFRQAERAGAGASWPEYLVDVIRSAAGEPPARPGAGNTSTTGTTS
ncbi:MAG: hypothetical protein QOI78_808 [Actinomycetota bacterium]|jgi:hypothetical protein|nr:hypothetical protein [Actinomycetota bacterium]